MTKRAFILGLAGAILMGVYGQYAGKYVPGIWGLVRGYMPVTVYGFVILSALALNPLLGKVRRSWRLRPGELGLIFAMMLVACGIADGGLTRNFPRMLVHPVFLNQVNPDWQKTDALSYTPPVLFAGGGAYDKEVVENYFLPMGSPGRPIPASAVPWHAWAKPLGFWTPLILLGMLGAVCLAVLVHRQWANKERLRYPLAEMVSVLLRRDETGRIPIFRDRVFWTGFAILASLEIVNGLHVWFPSTIAIPMSFDFSPLRGAFP